MSMNTEDVGMMDSRDTSRVGAWMECYGGGVFYPLDPRPEEVDLEVIAHHLSRINRYNGAARLENYSVAEHSVLLSQWVLEEYADPHLAYQGLMHDGTEAYVGDMIRPLKRMMPAFTEAEEPVWRAIVDRFPILQQMTGGKYALDKRIKDADNRILVDERAQVMAPSDNEWGIDHMEPLSVVIHGWRPDEAKSQFLNWEESLRNIAGY